LASGAPGLRVVARIPLPGGNSRLDYASLDSRRGLLFVAHLGASQVLEINIRTGRVVRAIGGLSQVHGVLVVPALHRVYATATGTNMVVRINEDTGQVLGGNSDRGIPRRAGLRSGQLHDLGQQRIRRVRNHRRRRYRRAPGDGAPGRGGGQRRL
jgi:hypothetical protein